MDLNATFTCRICRTEKPHSEKGSRMDVCVSCEGGRRICSFCEMEKPFNQLEEVLGYFLCQQCLKDIEPLIRNLRR